MAQNKILGDILLSSPTGGTALISGLSNPVANSDADNKGSRDAAIAAAIAALPPSTGSSNIVSSIDASLAAWMISVTYVANDSRYPAGTELLLPEAGDPEAAQFYQNGGVSGTAGDWSLLGNRPQSSQIRALFSGENGISYDSGTGKIGILSGLNGSIGDGIALTFTVNVPIDDVICAVREASTGVFVQVPTKVVSGVVTFTFAVAPSANQYKYSIIPAY